MRAKSSLWYLAAILLGGGVLAIVIARNLHSSPSPPAVSSGLSEVFTGAGGINAPSGIATNEIVNLSYEVVQAYPHDRKAFTQGLIYLDGIFIESTGLNGQSKLRKVELQTGKVLQEISLPFQYFAEGLAQLGGKLFQLTWQNGKCFVYDLDTLKLEKEFTYSGEGWGLTTDGHSLILSDGSAQLRFLSPATFAVQRTINVTAQGQPITRLNELEVVNGQIWANVWQTDLIVCIEPGTGKVQATLNLKDLLPKAERDMNTDVLNGIAFDPGTGRIFVTGKNWPKLFQIKIKP